MLVKLHTWICPPWVVSFHGQSCSHEQLPSQNAHFCRAGRPAEPFGSAEVIYGLKQSEFKWNASTGVIGFVVMSCSSAKRWQTNGSRISGGESRLFFKRKGGLLLRSRVGFFCHLFDHPRAKPQALPNRSKLSKILKGSLGFRAQKVLAFDNSLNSSSITALSITNCKFSVQIKFSFAKADQDRHIRHIDSSQIKVFPQISSKIFFMHVLASIGSFWLLSF